MPSSPTTRALMLAFACLAVAALLTWPALANHYPLLFPDTLGYLSAGRPALHALLHGPPFEGMRSPLYALAILPFHLQPTPWPILLFHAAPVVYTVYLTTRSLTPRQAFAKTLAVLAALAALTSLSWYISLLMPDVLGAPLYLALYLLTFARPTLTRAEQALLAAIAILGLTAHTTHLILAIFLILAFAIKRATKKTPRTPSQNLAHLTFQLSPIQPALLVIAIAIIFQLATNARLYGHASLDGNRPPYLEARLLADGPATHYLQQHCPDPHLPVLCRHLDNLPPNDDAFLWDDHGIWPQASLTEKQELLREEGPLALATLRTYPREQLKISARNFGEQLNSFGLDSFDNNDYMQAHLDDAIPHARAAYDHSLQSRNAVPWRIPTLLQNILVPLALLTLALTYRTSTPRLRALAFTVLAITISNAALTGVFSEVDSRYQARIIWLIPFAALLALLEHSDSSFPRSA